MNILYIKRAYNTRLHTQIEALYERGHSIVLLLEVPIEYGYNGPGQWNTQKIYSKFTVLYSRTNLIKLANNPWLVKRRCFLNALDEALSKYKIDLIISGNDAIKTEDCRTELVIKKLKGKVPVIYDCQDFLSDCFSWCTKLKDVERFVNESADGVIHTNPVGFKWITSKYKVRKGLVFPNLSSTKYFRKKFSKLSKKDGKIRLVYCGSVQKSPKKAKFPFARDAKNMFKKIASLGFPLHLYLGLYPHTPLYKYYMELESVENIIMHPYLPYEKMMQALTRYDVGLFPIDLSYLQKDLDFYGPQVLDNTPFSRTDTSKQYEYTLAGLSVLTVPIKWVSMWLTENNFGTSFNSILDLNNILESKKIEEFKNSVEMNAAKFSIENKIEEMENYLLDILNDSK